MGFSIFSCETPVLGSSLTVMVLASTLGMVSFWPIASPSGLSRLLALAISTQL